MNESSFSKFDVSVLTERIRFIRETVMFPLNMTDSDIAQFAINNYYFHLRYCFNRLCDDIERKY